MSKNLVIVESPAKAKTIEKYLGKDFHVLSSVGHIRVIPKKTKDGTPPVDVKNNFKTIYEIDPEKKKVISELRKQVKLVGPENVWLATDEDREGEAIAWHLCEVLKLNPESTKRITFHEITKSAIEDAIKNPRAVNMKLVAAQQARQILDRIVGFELSPVVWKKVPGGKSAGRVQSPAVKLLVEREQEIDKFNSKFQFKVNAIFTHNNKEIKAELKKRFNSEEEARTFLENLKDANYTVSSITTNPSTQNPSAPFTTSTLQQEANSKLGMSSKSTMASAQKLYQDGLITYMRTDSVNLSSQALASITEHIKQSYGDNYCKVRKFKTKSASAQEAHEAIRPTDINRTDIPGSSYDQKLYDLIRRRTIASQMSSAELENTTIIINISNQNNSKDLVFEAKGQIIIFDGFLKVYDNTKDTTALPNISKGESLTEKTIEAKQVFSRPPARYTEGTLVKKLEDLGIGRPSTYASIISTIQTRGYAEKGASEGESRDVIVLKYASGEVSREIIQEKTGSTKGKLVPTPSGELISGFLTDHFNRIIDYGFTAEVEKDFDQIANDKLQRNEMLSSFYEPFHNLITQSGGIDRSTVGNSREVGVDPKTNKPIIARFGRFGPMLQLGSADGDEKPQFAPMPKGTKIETITIEQALKAFKLPRLVGQTPDGKDIKANIGRFGPYIQVGKLFISIRDYDPYNIDLETSLQLYEEKLKAEAEKNIADFGSLKILNGRYGPYITDGKKNVKIPKDIDPKKISETDAEKMFKEAPAKKSPRNTTKKSSK